MASAAEVAAMRSRVRRLAGELPDFESVWVDALAQARIVTSYQAAEINAGRGESLACGPYVIVRPLPSPAYAACFTARNIETTRMVRLYVVKGCQVAAATAARAIGELATQLASLHTANVCAVDDAGHEADRVWAACPTFDGITAADWMAENGRFPPVAVMHIAREMISRLAALERLSQAHGDIGAAGLILQSGGQVMLPMPGLRAIVRPHEGYSFNDLSPEAYDYLAPERIATGSPPTLAGDVYGCGCLWWHLLTGRAPFGGGNSLTKLQAVHAAKLVDVRQLASDVPDALAGAIERCAARDPAARPRSIADLASLLGPAPRGGAAALSRCLGGHGRPASEGRRRARRSRRSRMPTMIAAIVVASALAMLALQWNGRGQAPHGTTSLIRATSTAKRLDRSVAQPNTKTPGYAELPARDAAVTLATAVEPAGSTTVKDMVLSADDGWQLDSLALKTGQRVRGPAGSRPRVSVPPGGLVVGCDDVSFENIDFVCEARDGDRSTEHAAMIVIAGQSVELLGCSLAGRGDAAPAAIRWNGSADRQLGPGGELTLRDCVVSGLAAVFDCPGTANLSVRLSNTLCLAAGPIVRLRGRTSGDERLAMSLDHVATRGDGAVLEVRYGKLDKSSRPIEISIIVTASALDTNPGGGLLVFAGAQRPDPLLRTITWSGDGSLVTPQAAMAVWHGPGDKRHVLPEDALEIAGLVRSRVEFAGSAEGPPSASRVIRWQAPLRSPEAPGIDSNSLYLPRN